MQEYIQFRINRNSHRLLNLIKILYSQWTINRRLTYVSYYTSQGSQIEFNIQNIYIHYYIYSTSEKPVNDQSYEVLDR